VMKQLVALSPRMEVGAEAQLSGRRRVTNGVLAPLSKSPRLPTMVSGMEVLSTHWSPRVSSNFPIIQPRSQDDFLVPFYQQGKTVQRAGGVPHSLAPSEAGTSLLGPTTELYGVDEELKKKGIHISGVRAKDVRQAQRMIKQKWFARYKTMGEGILVLDADRDGKISASEFSDCVHGFQLGDVIKEGIFDALFALVDKDRNGTFSYPEVKRMLNADDAFTMTDVHLAPKSAKPVTRGLHGTYTNMSDALRLHDDYETNAKS